MKIWLYNHVVYFIKQLFPLLYSTEYGIDDEWHVTTWNMWFGRCYNVKDWLVKED